MVIKNVIHYCNISTSKCFKLPESVIPYYDFTFMLEGEMTYYANGRKIIIKKDDALFLPPGTVRSRDEDNKRIKYVSYNFYADDVEPSLEMYMPKCITSDIKKIVSTLPVGHLTHEPYTRQKSACLLNYILLVLAYNKRIDSKNPHIQKILRYIDEHIVDKMSLSDIAKNIHLSKEYTSAIFTKEMGKSITEYINEQKVLVAAELIKTTDMSLGEVALTLGFENYNYFSRIFKKHHGISALQYKKNASLH